MYILELGAAGAARLVINPDHLTMKKVRELIEGIVDVRKKYSIFTKYPIKDNETTEQWQERVGPQAKEDDRKKEGESADDFLTRRLSPDMDKFSLVVDLIALLGKQFCSMDLDETKLQDLNFPKARKFLQQLIEAECGVEIRELD